jgi:broad specificity phosphatase PhoE
MVSYYAPVFGALTVLLLAPAYGLSMTTTTGGWSDVAIKAAKTMTTSNQERLRNSGVLDIQRPVKIVASSLDAPGDSMLPSSASKNDSVVKIIHFQRHGQGFHNLLGDVWRGLEAPIDMDSTDKSVNPWVMPELLDSPLTETGKDQCRMRRPDASILNPQLVVVSPLARAIQTAYLTFQDHGPTGSRAIPWVAHEDCREEMGLLICNKRRPLSHIQEDYPDIDFSLIQHEQDVPFDTIGTDRRESPKEKTDRIYDFLTKYIQNRPEEEIAVVGHSGWLFYMLNAVMDCQDDTRLEQWFLTSEVRSMRVTFESSTNKE